MCTYRFNDPELERSFFRDVFGVEPVPSQTVDVDEFDALAFAEVGPEERSPELVGSR